MKPVTSFCESTEDSAAPCATNEAIVAVCPACGSRAVYRYGKSYSGKQRYVCIMCNRQFLPGSERRTLPSRPLYPLCGRPMHKYMTSRGYVRFRCSAFSQCRTYTKVPECPVGEYV